MSNTPQTIEADERWWIAVDGRVEGPRSTHDVSSALLAGQLSTMSLVCLQGDTQWKPLAAWPALATLAGSAISPPPLPPLAPSSVRDERLLTNALLPPMANLTCVYAIAVVPLYWMFGVALLLREDNPFLEGTGGYLAYGANILLNLVVTLALTVVLAIGGIRFRDLRASGEWLIRLTLGIWSAWIVMQIFLHITLLIIGGVTETLDDSSSDISPWDVFQAFVALAAWCCDIVAMVWLFRRRGQLPLDSQR
jgi:hypothetical protein